MQFNSFYKFIIFVISMPNKRLIKSSIILSAYVANLLFWGIPAFSIQKDISKLENELNDTKGVSLQKMENLKNMREKKQDYWLKASGVDYLVKGANYFF